MLKRITKDQQATIPIVSPPMTTDLTFSPLRLESDIVAHALARLRNLPLSWTSIKSSAIDSNQLSLLRELSQFPYAEDPVQRGAYINERQDQFAATCLHVLTALTNQGETETQLFNKSDLVNFLLSIIYDGASYNNQFILKLYTSHKDYTPFVSLLNLELDDISKILSLYTIVSFLTLVGETKGNVKIVKSVYLELTKYLKASTQLQYIGLQLLKELLNVKSYRGYFNASSELLDILEDKSIELQMKYLTIYALWVISFDSAKINLIIKEHPNLIPVLFNLANDAIKEKVTRLSISILVNIITLNPSLATLKKYHLANGLTITKNLIDRKWSDEDLKNDLNLLLDQLNDSLKDLTTFDEYENELLTHHLHWSPCHANQEFWVDNIDKFKANNWSLVRQLIELLDYNVNDNEQLFVNQAIVCFDLGMIIKLDDSIVRFINNNGYKEKIMQLMNSPNSNVKFEALRTTQLLVSKTL